MITFAAFHMDIGKNDLAGIQVFHRHRLDRGVAFLRDCLRLFETRYQAAAGWGGDQDALRDMTVGADVTRESIHETRNWLLQDHWFDNCDLINCRESGWHIIHLCMLVGGARWLIRNTYDAKSGYFRYTPCKKRTKGGTFQHTRWVMEGLADAFALSRDEEIGNYVRDGLKTIGRFPDGQGHSGLGKAMAMQMRYVPGIQAALAGHPLQST